MTIGLKLKEMKDVARTLQLALFFLKSHNWLIRGACLKKQHGITNN